MTRTLYQDQKKFLIACIRDDVPTIESLFPHVREEGVNCLCIFYPHYEFAIKNGKTIMLSNFVDSTPLGVATSLGNINSVKKIIELGANPLGEGTAYSPALKIASKNGDDDMIATLLSAIARRFDDEELFSKYCKENLQLNNKYHTISNFFSHESPKRSELFTMLKSGGILTYDGLTSIIVEEEVMHSSGSEDSSGAISIHYSDIPEPQTAPYPYAGIELTSSVALGSLHSTSINPHDHSELASPATPPDLSLEEPPAQQYAELAGDDIAPIAPGANVKKSQSKEFYRTFGVGYIR